MPTGDREEPTPYLYTDTEDLRLISGYSGLNFSECMELDCYTYKVLLKDAFIHDYKKTEEGRNYLEECYLLQQTQPNRKKLRERFGD